jgi:phosphatidylinositol-3-phosphatase
MAHHDAERLPPATRRPLRAGQLASPRITGHEENLSMELQRDEGGVSKRPLSEMGLVVGVGAAVLALVLVAVLGAHFDWWRASTSQAAPAAAVDANVCGSTDAPPSTYKHVVWIFEENHNFEYDPKDPESGIVGNPAAPFLNDLAKKCTYSTAFHDTQPDMQSEPHYLTALSGSNCNTGYGRTGTGCITDDKSPSHHVLTTPNLLSQLDESHRTWTSYQESAPSNCYKSTYNAGSGDLYAPKHDPAVFFTNLAESCAQQDVPFPTWTPGTVPSGRLADDIRADRLPDFSFITPNLQNDMHISTGSNAKKGDAWLAAYLPLILSSKSYLDGGTAVFVLWDETQNAHSTTQPNLIIAPTAHRGPISTPMNNIAVLGATQKMLGLVPSHPYLGCASGKPPANVGQCPPGSTADVRQDAHV